MSSVDGTSPTVAVFYRALLPACQAIRAASRYGRLPSFLKAAISAAATFTTTGFGLATLQDDVCRPAVIEEAIWLALEDLAPARQDRHREHLATELATVRQETERLAEAIGRGGPLDALLGRLTERQARATAIEQELGQMRDQSPLANLDALETRLRAKLADWRGRLTRNVAEGRAVLRALLIGPLRFTPIENGSRRGYAFTGTIALDRLLSGVVELPTMWRPRRDSNPCFSLERATSWASGRRGRTGRTADCSTASSLTCPSLEPSS